MPNAMLCAAMLCALTLGAGAVPVTNRPEALTPAEIREREHAAEPLYHAALSAAHDGAAQEALLDAVEAALKAGACPTRTLTDDAFATLHETDRFRALIGRYAHQSETCIVLGAEPGEPLRVTGRVTNIAREPVPNALVFVYQTDANGRYSRAVDSESHPRIFGFMRTDDDGRFAFRTIRPGAQAGQSEPVEQNIHMKVTAKGFVDCAFHIGFEDDPFWKRKLMPCWVVPVTRDDEGVPTCQCPVLMRHPITSTGPVGPERPR